MATWLKLLGRNAQSQRRVGGYSRHPTPILAAGSPSACSQHHRRRPDRGRRRAVITLLIQPDSAPNTSARLVSFRAEPVERRACRLERCVETALNGTDALFVLLKRSRCTLKPRRLRDRIT